ncbi:MAG: hypothetical protein R3F13_00075 [Prosthecobacter sp.]
MTDFNVEDNVPPRRSRARQRETMTNAVATVLGCMAMVVMIATVVRVVMVKLWDSTRVNPDYVQSVYEGNLERRWSGNVSSYSDLPLGEPSESSGAVSLPPTHKTAYSGSSSTASSNAIDLTSASPGLAATTRTRQSGVEDIESKRSMIETAVRGFFEAATIQEKLRYVRDPGRVGALMTDYYGVHPLEHHVWKGLGWVLAVKEPGYRLGYAQAIFDDSEPVSLIIEETPNGTITVDWESSVRYGELDWAEFIRTRPGSPTLLRVIASKPTLSPLEETPPGTEVLEIKHPDEDTSIFAYFDPRDPKLQPLVEQLQNGHWKDVPLTLRLCYPGPASGAVSGVRIADIEGKGWLILQGTRS